MTDLIRLLPEFKDSISIINCELIRLYAENKESPPIEIADAVYNLRLLCSKLNKIE